MMDMMPMAPVEALGQPQGDAQFLQKPQSEDTITPDIEAQRKEVKRWQDRIEKAERHWEDDFKRMRDCMDFVAGFQWASQPKLDDERYIANLTIRAINQKVATLYARNPQVAAIRRKRLDFRLWDGKMETIQQAYVQASLGAPAGMVPPETLAVLQDFTIGRQAQELIERVCRTLEIAYQYQCDVQEPDFKVQAKQFVRRVSVTGVGYMKVMFQRDQDNELTHSATRISVQDRVQRAKAILQRVADGDLQETDADVDTLKSLIMSLGVSPLDTEAAAVQERLVFDFPQATSIIVDPDCRCLKGLVGAHWVAEQFNLPLEYVKAFYEKDIKPGTDLLTYTPDGQPVISPSDSRDQQQDPLKQRVKVYQVWSLDTKSTFTILKGYKDYLDVPETVTPSVKGFWTIFPLTFNDVEREAGCKSSIFPPSDVQLLKPVQKEWNRTRQALRMQRKANAPKYIAPKGVLTQNDKENIQAAEDNQIIELEGLPPATEPGKILQPFAHAAIDPAAYDTRPLAEDTLLTTGQQEANIGPAQPNVTATVGSIAEQSRMTVASSNVDDLDDCLSAVARAGGEMLLREMSTLTIQRIVGPGAAWPETNKEPFINEIELQVVAASSGRPNKALEVANWERLAPLLIQAGANPQAVIRETVKRADDRLEPADFFPLPLPPMPVQEQGGGEGAPASATPKQAPQGSPMQNGANSPVPLAGA